MITIRPASQKQIELATTLGKEIATRELDSEQEVVLATVRNVWADAIRNGKAMSGLIEVLLDLKRKTRPERTAAAVAPEGMHRLDDVIYKVQIAVHGSGRPYAKRLETICTNLNDVANDDVAPAYEAVFTPAPGVVRRLSTDTLMPLEAAKEFGALYGVCCVCGRTLTDEASIEAGIGPICAEKF